MRFMHYELINCTSVEKTPPYPTANFSVFSVDHIHMITTPMSASILHSSMVNQPSSSTTDLKITAIPKELNAVSFSMEQKAVLPLIPHASVEPTIAPHMVAPFCSIMLICLKSSQSGLH